MYLITGGSGFLGTGLARRLTACGGMSVRIFDLRGGRDLPAGAEFFRGDIREPEDVGKAVEGASTVFHLASLLPCARAGKGFYEVNVEGTRNLMEACLRQGVKRVVYVSSSCVYGLPVALPLREDSPVNPVGDYGRSKLLGEEVCRGYISSGMRVSIIRPRFIVGSGRLGILEVIFGWVRENRKVYTIGRGNNRFQMVGIEDLIDACLLVAGSGKNDVYNIGADGVPTVRELLAGLIRHARSSSALVPLNATAVKLGMRILDALNLVAFSREQYLFADKEYILDTSKAKEELGWKPKYTHAGAFNSAYDWYINNQSASGEENKSDHPPEKILRLLKYLP